jgi:hypothetical protein
MRLSYINTRPTNQYTQPSYLPRLFGLEILYDDVAPLSSLFGLFLHPPRLVLLDALSDFGLQLGVVCRPFDRDAEEEIRQCVVWPKKSSGVLWRD